MDLKSSVFRVIKGHRGHHVSHSHGSGSLFGARFPAGSGGGGQVGKVAGFGTRCYWKIREKYWILDCLCSGGAQRMGIAQRML